VSMSESQASPGSNKGGPPEAPADESLPRVSPDLIEQDHGDEFDDIVPSHGYRITPMAGLGG
jgi:hypothetical protein